MTITTSDATTILGSRLNRLLAAAGLANDTTDLNDAIAYAVRKLGYTVADASAIADSDLTDIGTDEENKFFDIAEYRGLETLVNEFSVKVTMQVGPRRQQYSDIAIVLDKILTRKAKALEREYGIGLATIGAGLIDLAFAETNSTTT